MSEEDLLGSNGKEEFVVSVRFHFADLPNQVDSVCPTQIPGQLSSEKAGVKQVKIMTKMCTHLFSMGLAKTQICIALLRGTVASSTLATCFRMG